MGELCERCGALVHPAALAGGFTTHPTCDPLEDEETRPELEDVRLCRTCAHALTDREREDYDDQCEPCATSPDVSVCDRCGSPLPADATYCDGCD